VHALCAKLGVKVTPYVAANMLANLRLTWSYHV
jgi:hypothetical protein